MYISYGPFLSVDEQRDRGKKSEKLSSISNIHRYRFRLHVCGTGMAHGESFQGTSL